MSFAIETHGLSKQFGSRAVVSDVELSVPAGSVYGFLGPNGAGKTTTIRLLLGLISADRGGMELLGSPMPGSATKVLKRVGTMVEGPGFIPYLSGEDNLRRLLSSAGVKSREQVVIADRALERVGLASAKDKKASKYSMGMKQRLSLAWALALPRELYILDEPTNGLDPTGMKEVRELVSSLAHEGSTVFISSHLLLEVEQVCTHVALMSQGKLVRNGELTAMRAEGRRTLEITVADARQALAVIVDSYPGREAHIDDDRRVLVDLSPDEADITPGVNRLLVGAGLDVFGLRLAGESLEEIFVEAVGDDLDVRQ